MIIEILFYTSLTEIKVDELNEAAKAGCELVKAHIDLYENQTKTNWKITVVAQEKVYEIIQNSQNYNRRYTKSNACKPSVKSWYFNWGFGYWVAVEQVFFRVISLSPKFLSESFWWLINTFTNFMLY